MTYNTREGCYSRKKNTNSVDSNMLKRPTIFDVARLAGVSITSVSRVINNSKKVKESVRDKILDAIKKLDYQPSTIAQGLARKKTKTIAIIITDITNPFLRN
jgi:LacI family transcriptional regulator